MARLGFGRYKFPSPYSPFDARLDQFLSTMIIEPLRALKPAIKLQAIRDKRKMLRAKTQAVLQDVHVIKGLQHHEEGEDDGKGN